MAVIRVRTTDVDQTFDQDAIVVGRAPGCAVVVNDARVSRQAHLVIRRVGQAWHLEDHSRAGTWLGDDRLTVVPLEGETTLHLGAPDGPWVIVGALDCADPSPPVADPLVGTTPSPATERPTNDQITEAAEVPSEFASESAPEFEADPVPEPLRSMPPPPAWSPGAPAIEPGSQTVAIDDRALRLNSPEQKLIVPVGGTVVVGRDSSCDLVSGSSIVSRQHCRFTHDGSTWILEDLGSTRGTFIDGKRLTTPYRVEGVFEIVLGDDNAGEKIQVITAGEHQVPSNKVPWVLGAVALVAALLALGVALSVGRDSDPEAEPRIDTSAETSSGDDSGGDSGDDSEDGSADGSDGANTDRQLSEVKQAVVLIEAVDRSGNHLWTGSGTVITEEGHILTNAHVADPRAESLEALEPILEGLDSSTVPDAFVIWVPSDEDEPAEPAFVAELVATSETQDAAVIQITEDLDGDRVDGSDLPFEPVRIGSSDSLHSGQKIHSLGYPANALTTSVSVVEGEVVSFISADEFTDVAGGDGRRVMNTNAILGQGSSGGPVVRDGEIVGLNFTQQTVDNLDRGWSVPIDEIEELLDEVDAG